MKHFFALMAALFVAFSMVGCGDGGGEMSEEAQNLMENPSMERPANASPGPPPDAAGPVDGGG